MKVFTGCSSILFVSILLVPFVSVSLAEETSRPNYDIIEKKDVVYATVGDIELKLDIAYPKNITSPIPAIVHIHGGGWKSGTKNLGRARFFANAGFVGISIEYRLSTTAKFPSGVHDCKTAIRWVRANAKKYKIDSNRIGVTGESAGGHLAALIGTSGGNRYLEGSGGYNEYSSSVHSVVDHFGPTDFLRMHDKPGAIDHNAADSPESLWIGGPITEHPDLVKKANPITYVSLYDPPILIIHGSNDRVVIFNQSEMLYHALKVGNAESRLVQVKNADHEYRPNPPDSKISPSREEINKLTLEWFYRTLNHRP